MIQKQQQKIVSHQNDLNQKQSQEIYRKIKQFSKSENKYIDLYNLKLSSKHLIRIINKTNCINSTIVLRLLLYQNEIDDEGIECLTNQSIKWNQLQQLDLSKNNISLQGVLYLSKAAEMKCFTELKQLNLSNNNLTSSLNNKQFQKQEQGLITKFANEKTKLRVILLKENNINDDIMKTLFKTNYKNKKIFSYLQKLSLSTNNIKDQGIKILTKQRIQFPSINILLLDKNLINQNGIKNLVTYKNKKTFNNLKQLYLTNNIYIRNMGIFQLFRGFHLGAFPLLQKLSLRNINMSSNGIEFILKSYYGSKSLNFLNGICIKNNLLVKKAPIQKKLEKRFLSIVQQIII